MLTLSRPWSTVLAWSLVVLPVVLVGVFVWTSLHQAIAGWSRSEALQADVGQLTESLAEADAVHVRWMQARQLTAETLVELSDPARSREAFSERFGAFLSDLEAAGVATDQASGVGESVVTERVGELHAVWAGVAPVEVVLSILEDPRFRPLRVAEMSLVATGVPGDAEIILEFRQPYLIGAPE
ncbi:hypothetical protein [Maricaulis maris]|uniref:hypothetical protein n=1 Tax=Maricaulis maris TaxID=74318 RepID=UPI003B8AF211